MLTDAQIRRAKPKDRAYRLSDYNGLHLYITPAGGKHWRMRYKFDGKEKTLTFGPYPEVSLSDARSARDEARSVLRDGLDPSVVKRHQQESYTSDTFENLAREWYERTKAKWTKVHAGDVIRSLERDVFPDIGKMPIRTITAPDVLAVLRKIEGRPAVETAHRVRQRMSAVFVYAIASGRASDDPAAIVKGALMPVIKKKQPAILSLDAAREMLSKAESIPAYPVTKLALRILALTVVRPGELRGAMWDEIDGDTWTVPAQRMKMKREHVVPLSRQAIEAFDVLRTITGELPYCFPNSRHAHRIMSENAIGYLLNRAGYHHRHVPHGWRATFSTVMNDLRPQDDRIIDSMLAHQSKDRVEGAYNRATYLEHRRELAQQWADMLLKGFPQAESLLGGLRHAAPISLYKSCELSLQGA